jgi:peptidyl-prolyl cis-trans isomerase C
MTPSIRIVRLACIAAAAIAPLTTLAQNVATVNGKPVPKARVDLLLSQAARGGQQKSPELEARAREEVVLREIFAQEAEKRGIPAGADYKAQMELVRQTVLIRELFEDFKKKNPVTDAEAKAEYDKFKSQATGTEYKARHILVENEDEAKKLITQIKGGAKFEELAKKNSKDTGSGENGGDLDFAKPDSYVPEFGKAMVALKKGEMTDTPVKTQYGYHIIRLEDTREAQFPEFNAVKPQIEQRLAQTKLQKYQEDLRKSAKTDFKFSAQQ